MENRTGRVNQLEPVVDYLCDDLWRSKKVKTTCLGRVVVTDWEQGRDDIFPTQGSVFGRLLTQLPFQDAFGWPFESGYADKSKKSRYPGQFYEGDGRSGQNESSVFEAILVSQAAVKQTGNVGMYTATSMGPLPNRESV